MNYSPIYHFSVPLLFAFIAHSSSYSVVVQQIQPTPFLKQASFLAPDGHECMYIADLVKKISR